MKTCLLLLILTVAATAQTDFPDIGSIADIKGKNKVYIVMDTDHLKMVRKEVSKTFTIVTKPTEADFFLEYKVLRLSKSAPPVNTESETGQLDVFFYKDKKKVVAWSDSYDEGLHFLSATPVTVLVKRFAKAFKQR
jgi:hypothetical protein